ncbi:hypothetical protein Tco_1524168 [Tanacetum coccineum]
MSYIKSPLILIEKVKVTRYSIGPGEVYTKIKVSEVEELSRTRGNVATIRAGITEEVLENDDEKESYDETFQQLRGNFRDRLGPYVLWKPTRDFNRPLGPPSGLKGLLHMLNETVITTKINTASEDLMLLIVLGYDGLPIQSVAPPSPDYIPGPEEPHTPPVPQDEDERAPMLIQPHDPDYVPEPIYPEYIPLEDEHEFLDPEEYEDDETEDGPVDYPMDEGDDGDDDDGDSSRDDADDEDEEEEEEEEHLAPADSAVVVPTVELVSPPEGTEPVIPPPSTDITTTGARITVRLQASISLPPEAEVERLLAMPTPPPSPPISLSPSSTGERLARCTAPPALSSPPPVPSPLLPSSGCPTQIQTLRIASTQALIDAVTTALPSPPLPPSLYIPLLVDRKDDIPESEQPPRKRLCLSTLGSRYEVGESSTARPIEGRGTNYRDTWVDPAEAVPEVAPMTVGEVNTRVTELAELLKRDTHDLYTLLEDAQDGGLSSREAWAYSMGLSQIVHYKLQTHRKQVHETHSRMQQTEMAELQETGRRRKAQMAELLALREQKRRARQLGSDARVPDHQKASRNADSHI